MTIYDFTYNDPRAVGLRQSLQKSRRLPPYVLGFYGRPGSGKGTQIKRLATALGCHVIGLGDELRRIAANPADPDQAVCHTILAHGDLAPLPLAGRLMREQTLRWIHGRVDPGSVHYRSPGVIFDGIIRAFAQAPYLEALLDSHGCGGLSMIEIDVPAAACCPRLLQRGRHDDTPAQIAQRLAIFDANRAAVMGYYTDGANRQPSGHTLNGSGTVDEVTECLFALLPSILR